ncbi:nitroreductase family protein [Proteiniclasticum sp. C24MP]|uniref:nitroreductase family protein n=1 Tax=Proteiniclasticum sp. C24MP TaxID=3374101 RepID=UPI0037552689
MNRIFDKPVEEIIEKRKSVRTFGDKALNDVDKKELQNYMDSLSNPFGIKVKFFFLDAGENRKSLGTYGVIKGTVDYIGAQVNDGPFALEALGYEMEKLILFAASRNVGTCWLGGTFKREDFRKAMDIENGKLFPAITPVGYPRIAKSMTDNLVRFISKGDQRKPWGEIFFTDDFSHPLSREEAKAYKEVLEMVRLAPSASNKQPWRVLRVNGSFHFYEARSPGYSDAFSYDIQRLDLGIALCHFHLTASEKNLQGRIMMESAPDIDVPAHHEYRFSWISD